MAYLVFQLQRAKNMKKKKKNNKKTKMEDFEVISVASGTWSLVFKVSL